MVKQLLDKGPLALNDENKVVLKILGDDDGVGP